MDAEIKLNVKYKLIVIGLLVLSLALAILMLTQLIQHNESNKYFLGVIGMAVLLAFNVGEIILIAMSLKKNPMIEAVAFDGENRDRKINKMPLYVIIVISALALIGVTLTTIFFFLAPNEKVLCMCIIVLPISFFLLLNCVSYLLAVLMYRVKEMSIEEMINYKG